MVVAVVAWIRLICIENILVQYDIVCKIGLIAFIGLIIQYYNLMK
jgi:hypothetical protein